MKEPVVVGAFVVVGPVWQLVFWHLWGRHILDLKAPAKGAAYWTACLVADLLLLAIVLTS